MKKQRPLALLVEGNASTSALLRLRNFGAQVGPVKSTSLGGARRFVNANRVGFAVETLEELQDSRLILIRVPDEAVLRVIDEVTHSSLELEGASFMFCETWFGSDSMEVLRRRGAAVATLAAIPSQSGVAFLVEGDARAVRLGKQFIDRGGGGVLQIDRGAKALYFAAELLTTAMPVQFLSAAQTSLREAGISGRPLATLLDLLTARMLRNFKAGTRITEGGPLANCSPWLADRHFEAAMARMPALATLLSCSRENAAGPDSLDETGTNEPPASLPNSNEQCKSVIDGS